MNEISVYIHWPFCISKCPYCDFNSYVTDNINYKLLTNTYIRDIFHFSQYLKNKYIKSIFFGGGTPSMMPPKLIELVINEINKYGDIDNNTEITIELNPNNADKIKDFANTGINRLSIGIQSFNDNDLKELGRIHNGKQSINSIELAQKYFDNYSFDLIYARHNQTLNNWKKELEFAVSMANNHISLYQLIIEENTPFYKAKLNLPDQDLKLALYNLTYETLEKNNLKRYEISNFAKYDFQSIHNMNYWEYGEYIGVGPGAHGRLINNQKNLQSVAITKNPSNWMENNDVYHMENLTPYEILTEILYMGLRLTKGIDNKIFQKLLDKNIDELINLKTLISLQNEGLLYFNNDKIHLTDKGLLLHTPVIEKLL